ncbi:MAG: hypothetical protein NVS3B26_01130 [Mycobacteriales bacterium]
MAALARAVQVTTGLRSYAFRAAQELTGGTRAQSTVLTGQAVRPASISYQLALGGRTQQVITVGGRTYLRVPPGSWKALARPGATVDPLASLLALLHALSAPSMTGHSLPGQVPAAVLSQAGLAPAGAAANTSTPVTLALDGESRVTAVSLRLPIDAGGHQLLLAESTVFSRFNAVLPIRPPGAVARK